MNIFNAFKHEIIKILNNTYGNNYNLSGISVELPKEKDHGDLATNAAMVIAKSLGVNPKEIALNISKELNKLNYVYKSEIAGPGFINIFLEANYLSDQLHGIIDLGLNYGKSNIGNNIKINIEFVSANPTGPMHIGHARGAIYGDALANLLIFTGYDVTKEYYINDAGAQIETLAKSAFVRYLQALGE